MPPLRWFALLTALLPSVLRRIWALSLHGLLFTLASLLAQAASASTLDRAALSKLFPSPLTVGERDAELPVWPIFRNELTSSVLLGYVFESLDFAPVPGFSGTPVNLLIALDTQGKFLDVRVLSHHEPVFLEGLGEGPLFKFVEQYPQLTLQQNIKIGSNQNRGGHAGSANVYIDGVAKATASVRIINQSLLSASLAVARAKLGYAAGRDPDLIGRVRNDVFQPMDFSALTRAGLITTQAWRNAEVEAAFQGTVGEGQDDVARSAPDALFSELMVAHLSVPSVGRNLLSDAAWRYLSSWIEPGDHAFLVVSRGRYSFVDENYTSGAIPDRLSLQQGGLPIELRDLDLEKGLQLPPAWQGPDVQARVFKVISQSSLDPAARLDFALSVTRSKGQVLPEKVRKTFVVGVTLPEAYMEPGRTNDRTWHGIWRDRAVDIGVLLVALAGLSVMLAKPRWLTRSMPRLQRVRTLWLLFTLGFIGWHAQGQLSIVNLTALIQALLAKRDLSFFMYDPMTVLLWGFVLISMVAWGRGTFCGWLCPFGALQELIAKLAQRLRVPQIKLHTRTDARLKKIKYLLLALLLITPFFSAVWTDRLAELEPFKTSITLVFVRSLPFVLWAVALLALSATVYKGYCRYLCPLGAGMAVLGRVRLLNWIPRRAECGQPCQTCRHRCEYQAITPAGAVDYNECFQCLDCVVIHDSEALCAPLISAQRKQRVIPVHAALPQSPSA